MEATDCESEPLGLPPYRFEPISHEPDTSSESDSDRELPADFAACVRVDNTALGEHSQITSRSKGGEGVRSIVTKCDVREGGG